MKRPNEELFTCSSGSLVIRLGEPGNKLPGHFRLFLRDEKCPEENWRLGSGKSTTTTFVAIRKVRDQWDAQRGPVPTPNPVLAPKLALSGALNRPTFSFAPTLTPTQP